MTPMPDTPPKTISEPPDGGWQFIHDEAKCPLRPPARVIHRGWSMPDTPKPHYVIAAEERYRAEVEKNRATKAEAEIKRLRAELEGKR